MQFNFGQDKQRIHSQICDVYNIITRSHLQKRKTFRIIITAYQLALDQTKTYFDTPSDPDHLPLLKHVSSKLHLETSLSGLPVPKHPGALSVLSLRRLLRNESVEELGKLRERSEKRNYTKVREELLRDITNGKQFLTAKAEQIAKRILQEKEKCDGLNVGVEISKGKNYLNKIIKDFENMQGEKQKISGLIQERMRNDLPE